MIKTLATILADNWEWRGQIARLSLFELRKKSRGAVLSWAWLIIKPLIYISVFWFALEVGLRAGSSAEGGPPYILWLVSGLVPWFYMSDLLGQGSDVLHRYPYLVNKIKFPLSAISGIFSGATFLVHLMLLVLIFVIFFACGQELNIYLLQVPIIAILMFIFWDLFSICFSQLSAISKDVANLIKAFSTPIFWLSGIIFNVKDLGVPWVNTLLQYNPVTFFAEAYRSAFYYRTWFWEDTGAVIGFAVVFLLQLLLMLWVYKRFNEEVADVL